MKEIVRYGFILALICVIAAGALAGVNALTRSKILAQALAEEQSALKDVMPQAASFSEVKEADEILYYRALDGQGSLMGVVFKAKGKGYSSVIETLVGMSLSGKISAIKVVSLSETPGLGMRVTENSFCGQFDNRDALDLSQVQAISGATISSRAVIDSVSAKAGEIQGLMKNEK